MRLTPRNPYVAALIFTGAVVLLAWVNQDRYRPVGPGAQAPDFTATTLDGAPVSLNDWAGSVILLNIWATWCPPCREEMPSMESLYGYFQERGEDFVILAVSIDRAQGEADEQGNEGGDLVAFVQEFGLTFTILHDPSGDIQRTYQTTGVPESFIIDRNGAIVRKIAGGTNWDTQAYRELFQRLLDQPGPEGATEDASPPIG